MTGFPSRGSVLARTVPTTVVSLHRSLGPRYRVRAEGEEPGREEREDR